MNIIENKLLHPIHGVISKKNLSYPNSVDGKIRRYNNIITIDTKDGPVDISIIAEGDPAEELMRYNKGDIIYALVIPNKDVDVKNANIQTYLGVEIISVDHDLDDTLDYYHKRTDMLMDELGYPEISEE